MFTSLRLTNFKSFPEAELRFGPITTLIGANATGKSNLRDALRFLHGVGRGMTLPEIFGGKSSLGWTGIRGGAPGTVRSAQQAFSIQVTVDQTLTYQIEIAVAPQSGSLVTREILRTENRPRRPGLLFETREPVHRDNKVLDVRLVHGGNYKTGQKELLPAHQPILTQIAERAAERIDINASRLRGHVAKLMKELSSIRFLDFSAEALRQPAIRGGSTISESGDNLSSVLRYLVEDQQKGAVLTSWIKALTPMDVTRIGFEDYPDGKIIAVLEEAGGRKIPLSSASDGTLRFLGILASVLSPEPPSLLCFEEIETGLHPTRVQLVSELLQKETKDGKPQVLLTTHSPNLLGWLGREHRDHAYLAYRLPESADTQLKPFTEIPGLEQALEKTDAARLFESGWFEDAVFFAESKPSQLPIVAEDPPKPQP